MGRTVREQREKYTYNGALLAYNIYACVLMEHDVAQADVAQAAEHSGLKVWIFLHGGSILQGGCICSLGYFPFEPVAHNWSVKGCGMSCLWERAYFVFVLLLFLQATSKVISRQVPTVRTHGDFISLPHCDIRPPAPLSHIILTLSQPVFTILIMLNPWVGSNKYRQF